MSYVYLGDRFTDPALKGALCERLPGAPWYRGKTIVRFVATGRVAVVLCGNRRLRKAPAAGAADPTKEQQHA